MLNGPSYHVNRAINRVELSWSTGSRRCLLLWSTDFTNSVVGFVDGFDSFVLLYDKLSFSNIGSSSVEVQMSFSSVILCDDVVMGFSGVSTE